MSEKENLESQSDYLKSQLEWYNLFVDYTQSVDINLYNEACEYSDREHSLNENNDLTCSECASDVDLCEC